MAKVTRSEGCGIAMADLQQSLAGCPTPERKQDSANKGGKDSSAQCKVHSVTSVMPTATHATQDPLPVPVWGPAAVYPGKIPNRLAG
jgi:hypothetical protein